MSILIDFCQRYVIIYTIVMNKKEFIKLTGENPEDVLGPDWKNLIDEYVQDEQGNEHFHDGHEKGACWWCKMD